MVIAHVYLRLATIKGHSEMCSFALLGGGVCGGQKTSQYQIWPPFASHFLRIDLIRLLIVACGMLVQSSSMMYCIRVVSSASQTCSMGDMSSKYAGHASTAQNKRPLWNVQFYHTAQCHRCRKFWGSVQLSWWQQECSPELLPINWMFISLSLAVHPTDLTTADHM